MQITFDAVHETDPGPQWQVLFRRTWPGWRRWLLARTADTDPDTARLALRRYMPEFEPTWERLAALAGGDVLAARFLSFWEPPAYLVSCSQAVIIDTDGPLLLRNYDLDPRLSEATLLSTRWRGRGVIGSVDGIAGLADGINESGLALSLTFGGRRACGRGFGIPLILRYVLEECRDTRDAVEALQRVPAHMSYNVTLADRRGEIVTVFTAPDRPLVVSSQRVATNHQGRVEWPEQARFSQTLERERHLLALLAKARPHADALTAAFLRAPLYRRGWARGFGTVYTAAYRPALGQMALHWPGQPAWRQGFADFRAGQRTVRYGAPAAVDSRIAASGGFVPRPWSAAQALPAPASNAHGDAWLSAAFASALAAAIAGAAEPEGWRRFAGLWRHVPGMAAGSPAGPMRLEPPAPGRR